ncbi:MAG: NAD(P)-dependent oxidoreductase, partial [Candidatus Micrarchaeota archaeon]
MNQNGNARNPFSRGLKVAIYEAPKIVSRNLADSLARTGYEVLFEGKLSRETARGDADVWITKWSSNLNGDFLRRSSPRLGIVTLTVGTDHIDMVAAAGLGLRVEKCPTFSSNAVAEHAMALAFRGLYQNPVLPPLSSGQVIFTNFSDEHAEAAVAQMVMRTRQIDQSVERARSYYYLDEDGLRPDEPWSNQDLAGAKIGIVGQDRSAYLLARMLSSGLKCDVYGFETSEDLTSFYGVKPMGLFSLVEQADYVFLCTDRYNMLDERRMVNAAELERPSMELTGSRVAVLGTGGIGSIIARICARGFGCYVRAFSRSEKEELKEDGIHYVRPVEEAITDANFIFIALPLDESTRNLLSLERMSRFKTACTRVLVNVTRDKIVESEALFDFISRGGFLAYGTDVVPNDFVLWSGG